MMVRSSEQKTREKHLSSRERQLEKPSSGPAAAEGKSEGNGKRNWVSYSGYEKINALEEISVE